MTLTASDISDIASAVAASGGLTASQVWAYATRTPTALPASDMSDLRSAITAAAADPDSQVRRLAIVALAGAPPGLVPEPVRASLMKAALADPDPLVRYEALRIHARSLSGAGAETIPLAKLDLQFMTAGWGRPRADKSVTGTPLRIAQAEFASGVGTHAESVIFIDLAGQAERFQARVGVDDNAQVAKASLEFAVYGDDRLLFKSGRCTLGQPA